MIGIGQDEDLERLPGLYRSWDLCRVVSLGRDYRIEAAGTTADGAPLFAVWTVPDVPAAGAAE